MYPFFLRKSSLLHDKIRGTSFMSSGRTHILNFFFARPARIDFSPPSFPRDFLLLLIGCLPWGGRNLLFSNSYLPRRGCLPLALVCSCFWSWKPLLYLCSASCVLWFATWVFFASGAGVLVSRLWSICLLEVGPNSVSVTYGVFVGSFLFFVSGGGVDLWPCVFMCMLNVRNFLCKNCLHFPVIPSGVGDSILPSWFCAAIPPRVYVGCVGARVKLPVIITSTAPTVWVAFVPVLVS